jgi:hypothetical protein
VVKHIGGKCTWLCNKTVVNLSDIDEVLDRISLIPLYKVNIQFHQAMHQDLGKLLPSLRFLLTLQLRG